MSVWYDPELDELSFWYQRMLDEWVFEMPGFISPQYSLIPPYTRRIYIGEL
jgi:hypothetical protein